MATITLSKTETKHLVEAAGQGGALILPDSMKAASRERIVGRLLRDGLIRAGEAGLELTAAGYRAVGIRPPRTKRSEALAPAEARPTKLVLIRELLGRPEGASLSELIEVTGWLPHTTRAALSRLRSGGEDLRKSKRDDGATAYRIASAPIVAAPAGSRKRATAEARAAA